ncbi:Lrp/AsnC family transcriptional regulator [Brevibacterium jeotgali]|uniref:Transcriptional regulator, AsnC family n=1 Tax=Brevibacterium jeotgali TaxID=1262550 RepID=A0A2H1L3K6_9MICO|nr:Lrp/AsnC family transcriptional regulator [Brevibacterium jeotgali]TWC01733.1 Lrp/AsnC family transcriptional regulator for asnA, asnC and gidA [Brevibacterium jeotgali]SMY11478.1 transcriptional regulator, AsnC family [Brevibacterium jeotgali]
MTVGSRGGSTAGARFGDVDLDDKSKAIIEALQHDGRRSYADIGRDVGLSETAVRQRVTRLVENGTMQIVAVTNPLQLGFQRQAMIGLSVSGDLTTAAASLEDLPQVDYIIITAGTFDLLVEVVCADDDELLALLNDIRALPQVERTETMTYLKLWDQIYNWGTR